MKYYLFPVLLCLLQLSTFAQSDSTTVTHHHKSYVTWGGDGALLSFADVKDAGQHLRNIPRFTLFFNIGNNYNYDFNNHFGIFTGLNIKNIGLITKDDYGTKVKRRVYTLGVPLGFKIGDLRKGAFYFFAGGSYDLAFNYKEKTFPEGGKKHKFNEWFSDATPLLMPSVFAGIRMHPGIGLKVQYYPNNFYNTAMKYQPTPAQPPLQPFKDLDAKMFFVTLSYDFGMVHWGYKGHWEHKKHKHHWQKTF